MVSLAMHWPHLQKDLISVHAWRQTQTQSNTINFYEEDMNILNPRRNNRGDGDGIYRMEFPLYQWTNALLFGLMGNRVLITRLYTFLLGLVSVMGMYRFIECITGSQRTAAFGSWFISFSPSFFYFTINPLPDNMALMFSIWGLGFFYLYLRRQSGNHLLWSSMCLALAALCKLPFILYYAVPGFYFLAQAYQKKNISYGFSQILQYGSSALLVGAWYLWVIPQWESNPIVKGILENEQGSTQTIEYLYSNLISVLPELLLNYAAVPFFLYGVYYFWRHRRLRGRSTVPLLVLSVLLCAYALFEINAIKDKHDYYFFPFLPLLFLLVAVGAEQLYRMTRWTPYLVLCIAVVAVVTCALRMRVRWDEAQPGFDPDLLKYKQELRAAVPQDALVVAGNDVSGYIMFYYLDKKGWGFHDSDLTQKQLADYIARGAQYLYLDDPALISSSRLDSMVEGLVGQYGDITVYKLR